MASFFDRFRRKPPMRARGASGRGHQRGHLVPEEINPDLTGRRGLATFDAMYRTDPDVRRVVRLVINPILGATWTVEPHGGDEAEERDVEAAEALDWALNSYMRPTLPSHLAQALPVLIRAGFAPFEQVWASAERDGKTLLVPKTLGLRLPRTIYEWPQDGEELRAIVQLLDTGGTAEIPAADLVYYRVDAEGDNWEGTSMLRPAYKPWYIKDQIERLDAIKAEREAVGVPVLYPPANATSDVIDEMEEALQGLRTAEQSYVIMPGPKASSLGQEQALQGWDLEILTSSTASGSREGDLKPTLEYHADKIASIVLADFMRLGQGTQSVGARATADVQQDPFLAGVEALAGIIETALNESIVERFTALNFDVEAPPKLVMSLVDSTSLTELADYAQKLVNAKILIPDEPLEDFLRERADFPAADPEERERAAELKEAMREQAMNPPEPQPGQPPPGAGNGPKPPKPKGPAKQLARADRDLRLWEQLMALDEVESAIDEARARFEAAGGPVVRALVRQLVRSRAQRTPAPPDELVAALDGELQALYQTGRESVRRELAAQRGDEADAFVLAADDRRILRRRARLAAAAIVSRVWQAIQRAALQRPGVEAAAQEAGELEALAALRAEAQAHASAALNEGRGDEIDAHAEEIAGVRYTSILDSRRCDSCAVADDDVLRALDDPVRLARKPPNPSCFGGGRCRCLEFAQLRSEVPSAA